MFLKTRIINLLFALLSLSVTEGYGQSYHSDNIKLNINKPLVFNFNNINEVLQGKEINNALELKVKVKQNNCNVSASVNFTGQGQNEPVASNLMLRLRSKTSLNASVNSTTVPLSVAPSLLFMQPAAGINTEHYSFVYDLVLNPFTSFVKAANYNFVIIFTMSAP